MADILFGHPGDSRMHVMIQMDRYDLQTGWLIHKQLILILLVLNHVSNYRIVGYVIKVALFQEKNLILIPIR